MKKIIIVGAGLAGSEAAWQAAKRGMSVKLYEMRPRVLTPAHKTGGFAELVCSNSLRAASLENAVGVLKEEMRRLNSLVIEAADKTAVPAGGALAVDREGFSAYITEKIKNHPLVEVIEEEVSKVPQEDDAITICASGPLTAGALADDIKKLTGQEYLSFYDAAAPIVTAESVDLEKTYFASRYGKGEAAYLNCPMNEEEYNAFYDALVTAEAAPVHEFDEPTFFEGCMPVEVMAARGRETLLFGPLKPMGLDNPRTGERPHAVVQLRHDNAAGTLYNIVGFQTHLRFGEQKRVFGMIPGLENAEFVRYGVMHRNTFINSPLVLLPTFALKAKPNIFFAGQITGVEGYVESAAAGLMAGVNAARTARGDEPLIFPVETAHGALANYITSADSDNFQPMNVNFGIMPPVGKVKGGKKAKKEMHARLALDALNKAADEINA